MFIYYAHCQAIYGTPQEARDIELLQMLGFTVVNPAGFNQETINSMKEHGEDVMAWFCDQVMLCDALAFRALPDGRIPAGLAKEIAAAKEDDMPVFELPGGVLSRTIDVDETREYLREIGQR